MQKWNGSLLRKFDDAIDGNASVGTSIVVRNTSDNSLAVVYSVDDTNSVQKNNPFVTDDFGRYSFYAPNGKYTIEFGDGSDNIEIVLVDNITHGGLLDLNAIGGHDAIYSRNFDTVADMKAGIDSAGNTINMVQLVGIKVFWRGYYAESDGGGNWGIVKSGAHTEDGGLIFSLGASLYIEANMIGGRVSVKKFGATGDGVTVDQVAIENTIAYVESEPRVSTVYFCPPDVSYVTNAELTILNDGKGFKGEGSKSVIEYKGGAGNVVFMGSKSLVSEVFSRHQFFKRIYIKVSNKIDTINGLVLEKCIHFDIDDFMIIGGGSPNELIPLNGIGLHISKVSFIGRVGKPRIRLFNVGIQISTAGAASYESGWAAAMVISGHGELHNNNIGMLFTGTGGNAAGTSVAVRDITIEGNYQGGIRATAGNNITIDGVYFEANAGYNIDFDNTVSSTITRCNSIASPLLITPYGAVTYAGHFVVRGGNTLARVIDNNMVIQGGDYSAVVINSGANSTRVKDNRIAGTPATFAKIRDEAANSVIADNLGVEDLVWITPAKSNSWSDVASRPVVQYALDKRQTNRRVIFRGVTGSGTSGAAAFTIPAGFRPYDRLDFTGIAGNKITITTAGAVIITSTTSEVSFASVSYDNPI